MNRYKVGFVDVRNPFNHKLVSRINFEDVDAIIFYTKSPIPILFYVTLTPYKKDIKPNIPLKVDRIKAIKELSNIVICQI